MQVTYGDNFPASIEQHVGYTHVQRRVHDAVVARDQHDNALSWFQTGQQLVAQLLGFARELRDGEPAGQHGARRFLRRAAKLRSDLQHDLRHGTLSEIKVHQGIQQRDAVAFVVQFGRHDGRDGLHIRARVVVRHRRLQMANGVHAGHEHVVDVHIKQLRHVTVHQLHGVACLALCACLRKAYRLLIGCVGQHHVEAELLEESMSHRKQLVQHEAARNADRFLRRVARGVVAFEEHLVDFMEERAVCGNFGRVDVAGFVRGAQKVPALEVREHVCLSGGMLVRHRACVQLFTLLISAFTVLHRF